MIEYRPYAIAHDQAGAGLRAYMAIHSDASGHHDPRWPSWFVIIIFLAGILLGVSARAIAAPAPVMFVQPRVPIVLAPPTGTVIPVQLRIERHPDNRAYAITWCDGSSAHTLDGADDAAIQPMRPLNVRVAPGDCAFTATVFGAGGKSRATTSFVMHVCGGQEGDCIR